MVGTYNAPGKKYKGQDEAPDATPTYGRASETPAASADAAPTKKEEEPRQSALTNSSGQIALLGSSIDPEYEKAKEARRRARKLASTQADGIEGV